MVAAVKAVEAQRAVETQRGHGQAWDGKRGHVEAADAADAAETADAADAADAAEADEEARDRKRCRVGDE